MVVKENPPGGFCSAVGTETRYRHAAWYGIPSSGYPAYYQNPADLEAIRTRYRDTMEVLKYGVLKK